MPKFQAKLTASVLAMFFVQLAILAPEISLAVGLQEASRPSNRALERSLRSGNPRTPPAPTVSPRRQHVPIAPPPPFLS
ncbi:hypothetical protein BVRB_5g117850 [Beta vulgaris subsp. vulgaris]|nr:hypothetical protein BVRB_5g117850 [Beta vulgaris subsp. vulgaris]